MPGDNMKRLFFAMLITIIMVLSHTAPLLQAEEMAKDYSGLIGMAGFSDTLLANHFKLYQGYVKNTNTIKDKISLLSNEKKYNTPEYAELKRRLAWEFNGMLLHEYYFENLGGTGVINAKSRLHKKIVENFGSFDNWRQDFIATGLIRGIGWVVLYWEPARQRLANYWINEHDTGHITGASPILVMDVFEHAYMTDYQLEKAKYIEAFFGNINWKVVQDRFDILI